MSLQEDLYSSRIIAIVRGIAEPLLDDTAKALQAGGVKFIEVTMNTEGALQAISRWRTSLAGVHVGAGTVLNLRDAERAIAAGATYLISPNVDVEVIRYACQHQVEVWPGAMTPTEIELAYRHGATAVKLFPAGSLGAPYLREVRGPLSHIPLIATGGIHLDNAEQFLQAGAVGLGIGGNLVDRKLIEAQQFEELTAHARRYVEALRTKGGDSQ